MFTEKKKGLSEKEKNNLFGLLDYIYKLQISRSQPPFRLFLATLLI